jgi:hypothetical protein
MRGIAGTDKKGTFLGNIAGRSFVKSNKARVSKDNK